MSTLKDYLEEETAFLPVSDFPKEWLDLEDYTLQEGHCVVRTFSGSKDQTFKLLQITTVDGLDFFVIEDDGEDWLAFQTMEEYVAALFDDDLDYYDYDVD